MNLNELQKKAADCQLCALRITCQQVVFGEGPDQAGIMVIGEGPGRDEDVQGRPFVGRAGKLLDQILASGGFDRQKQVYIANIVKCRPPGNRVPRPEERQACLPYLHQQIELVDPKILILLGATALQGLIDPEGKIGQERGRWLQWQGRWVMATYHPAALLRNPRLKEPVWQDIKNVVAKYQELVDPEHRSPYIKE